MSYKPFFVVLVLSFFTMYSVMFLNVDEASHIYLSLTRFYMSLLMVCPMAIIMLIMMRKMYSNKKLNGAIITVVSLVFIFSLVSLRTQAFVEDRNYIKAMIPHHSSAILTSKHAHISDPELRQLSEEIISSQEKEIAQMKAILERLQK